VSEHPGTSQGERVIRRQRGVGKRTIWISILTLVSRVLGMVRESMSALLFGDTSMVYDAFLFAWRIPNLFRRFLGEGALSTSLQASLTKVDAEEGDEAGAVLFRATLGLVAKILLALCLIVVASVWLLPNTFPGTDVQWLGPQGALVREFTMRLMPFVIFVCLTAAIGGALNVRGHYTLPALGPVLLNVLWIACLVGITWAWQTSETQTLPERLPMIRWLSAGVLLAGLAQLLLVVPAIKSCGLWPTVTIAPEAQARARSGARGILRRSAPLAFGAAVYQVNVMIDGMMAQSLLQPGGQTVHYLANRVQQFPLALVAVAATTAVFPALAAFGQQRRLADLRALHDKTQRNVLFIAMPAAFGLACLALPVTSLLFEYGAFKAAGVVRTADALRVLAFAILPAGAVGLVARTYYSVGDFKTPVRVSCAMLVANVVMNTLFIRGLHMDANGLALATTLASFGNLFILLPGLQDRVGLPAALPGWFSTLWKTFTAAACCGLIAREVHAVSAPYLPVGFGLALAILTGAGIYWIGCRVLRVEEGAQFAARFKGISTKFRRKT
jgi:putative peptidoglycan lipid II flippase